MQEFVFRFGYCTPAQSAANAKHGWDDESSAAFVICASTPDDALAWGCKVAEEYVSRLFESNETPAPSWAASGFAYWIDDKPSQSYSEDEIRALPRLTIGELPNFEVSSSWP